MKPVVHFTGEVCFTGVEELGEKYAYIYGVLDHPRLGKCHHVFTSEILKHDETTVETLNTVYKKVN